MTDLTLNPSAITRRLNRAGVRRVYSYKPPDRAEVFVGALGGGLAGSVAIGHRFDNAETVLRNAGYVVRRLSNQGLEVKLP